VDRQDSWDKLSDASGTARPVAPQGAGEQTWEQYLRQHAAKGAALGQAAAASGARKLTRAFVPGAEKKVKPKRPAPQVIYHEAAAPRPQPQPETAPQSEPETAKLMRETDTRQALGLRDEAAPAADDAILDVPDDDTNDDTSVLFLHTALSGLRAGLSYNQAAKLWRENESIRHVMSSELKYTGGLLLWSLFHQMSYDDTVGTGENAEDVPTWVTFVYFITMLPLLIRVFLNNTLNTTTADIMMAADTRDKKSITCAHNTKISAVPLLRGPVSNTLFLVFHSMLSERWYVQLLGAFLSAAYVGKTMTFPHLCGDCREETQKKHFVSVMAFGFSPAIVKQLTSQLIYMSSGIRGPFIDFVLALLAFDVTLVQAYCASMQFKKSPVQLPFLYLSDTVARTLILDAKDRMSNNGKATGLSIDLRTVYNVLAWHDKHLQRVTGLKLSSLNGFTDNHSAYLLLFTLAPRLKMFLQGAKELKDNEAVALVSFANDVYAFLGRKMKHSDVIRLIGWLRANHWLEPTFLDGLIKKINTALEDPDVPGQAKHVTSVDLIQAAPLSSTMHRQTILADAARAQARSTNADDGYFQDPDVGDAGPPSLLGAALNDNYAEPVTTPEPRRRYRQRH